MSKTLELKRCSDCPNSKFLDPWNYQCVFNGEHVLNLEHDVTKDVDPNCPLLDSDAWKTELLEWIENNKTECDVEDRAYFDIVEVSDLKQKLREM